MYETILVPLDGSEFAEEALALAALMAETFGSQLHLAHVIRPASDVVFKTPADDFNWNEAVRDGAEKYLAGHTDTLRERGISTLTAVLDGRAAPALEQYAAEQGVDLTLLTTHGRGGIARWWLGSVADELLRVGQTHILIVRDWDETTDRAPGQSRFERILVPLDGSELAETAVAPALAMADRFGSTVRLVQVLPDQIGLGGLYGVGRSDSSHASEHREEAETYLRGLRDARPTIEVAVVEHERAAEGVVEAAKEWNADLITLSSHGRGAGERALLGSVADKVIRKTTRPVLVVR